MLGWRIIPHAQSHRNMEAEFCYYSWHELVWVRLRSNHESILGKISIAASFVLYKNNFCGVIKPWLVIHGLLGSARPVIHSGRVLSL